MAVQGIPVRLFFMHNMGMVSVEKESLVHFINLAAAYCRGGYRSEQPEYNDLAEKPGTDNFEQIVADVRSCEMCRLCKTRTNAVPGEGSLEPLVMVIGEGPGSDEDATGRPFVGKAGQLLDKMLGSIGLSRESNCFIANVIKCRPPGNRDPSPDETAACASFLERQIQILKPHFILCAGKIAAQTLLQTSEPIGKLRGKFTEYQCSGMAIPFLVSYHPSALLRSEDLKRPAWEDLKLLRSALIDAGLVEK